MRGKFIVISGPSGVGKGTICERLINDLDAWYSVSMTSREPREGDIEGVNYYFVTREKFEKNIRDGKLLEYNVYNNNYYGTPKDKVLEKIGQGINVFTEIDVNGAKNIKKLFADALLIYIAPPSIEVLRERLIGRGTESTDVIDKRLEIAKDEMKQTDIYDYVVVNDDLEETVAEVRNIILKEENRNE